MLVRSPAHLSRRRSLDTASVVGFAVHGTSSTHQLTDVESLGLVSEEEIRRAKGIVGQGHLYFA